MKKTRKWVKPIVAAFVVIAVGLVYIGLGHSPISIHITRKSLPTPTASIGFPEKAFSLDFLQVIFGPRNYFSPQGQVPKAFR